MSLDVGFNNTVADISARTSGSRRLQLTHLRRRSHKLFGQGSRGVIKQTPCHSIAPQSQNGCYNPYGGYPQQPPYPAPYPQPQPYQQNTDNTEEGKKGKKTKQKRVVSVGIAVFCIIMVLILSALCGYLFETCLRHGIDPLRPGKPSNNMVIVENSISEELQNG